MIQQAKKAVKSHRARQKRRGFTRVEVTVHKQDAMLIRDVAAALGDPTQAAQTRALIRNRFQKMDFKEFLASAPLEGIDLTRPPDFGRDIEL